MRQWPDLAVLAFDHRLQFEELAGDASHRSARSGTVDESEADRMHERIARFKRLLAEGGRRGAAGAAGFGMIVDDRYGDDVLPGLTGGPGWIARPVELPGSRPLRFEAGNDIALALRAWPSEHVAKCLVSYHPDDDATLRSEQLASLQTLQAACIATDRELLIEVIPPRELASDDDTLARALAQIYAAGVRPDWWKLPPPESGAAWQRISACIGREDPFCRGVLLLGLAASEDALAKSFALAAPHPICKGFAVGRSIFAEAAANWFAGQTGDEAVIEEVAGRYSRLIDLWRSARAADAALRRHGTALPATEGQA